MYCSTCRPCAQVPSSFSSCVMVMSTFTGDVLSSAHATAVRPSVHSPRWDIQQQHSKQIICAAVQEASKLQRVG